MSSNHQTFFWGGTNHNSPLKKKKDRILPPVISGNLAPPGQRWSVVQVGISSAKKKHGMITFLGLIMSIVNSYNKLLSIVNNWTIIIVND